MSLFITSFHHLITAQTAQTSRRTLGRYIKALEQADQAQNGEVILQESDRQQKIRLDVAAQQVQNAVAQGLIPANLAGRAQQAIAKYQNYAAQIMSGGGNQVEEPSGPVPGTAPGQQGALFPGVPTDDGAPPQSQAVETPQQAQDIPGQMTLDQAPRQQLTPAPNGVMSPNEVDQAQPGMPNLQLEPADPNEPVRQPGTPPPQAEQASPQNPLRVVEPQGPQQPPQAIQPGQFGDTGQGEIPLVPTEQETKQGYAAVQQLVKDYTTLASHINQISKTMKGDFGAWRQVYDTYKQIEQPWRNFQQQMKANPQMAARINPQSLQAAQQAFQSVLPLLGQQMQEQQQDMVQNQQILQGAGQVLQAIQSLLPNMGGRTASLTAYAGSAGRLIGY